MGAGEEERGGDLPGTGPQRKEHSRTVRECTAPWDYKSWLYFLTKGFCRVGTERWAAGVDTSATNVSPGLQGEGKYRKGGYLRWEQDNSFSLPSPMLSIPLI